MKVSFGECVDTPTPGQEPLGAEAGEPFTFTFAISLISLVYILIEIDVKRDI